MKKWYRIFSNSKYERTPIFINMARTKIIAKNLFKNSKYKVNGQDKVQVTVILWIITVGIKL